MGKQSDDIADPNASPSPAKGAGEPPERSAAMLCAAGYSFDLKGTNYGPSRWRAYGKRWELSLDPAAAIEAAYRHWRIFTATWPGKSDIPTVEAPPPTPGEPVAGAAMRAAEEIGKLIQDKLFTAGGLPLADIAAIITKHLAAPPAYDPSAALCHDCRLPYGSPAWADVVLPNDVWRQISPDGEGNGLLCFNCMNARLEAAGIETTCKITSGPLSGSPAPPTTRELEEALDLLKRAAAACADLPPDDRWFRDYYRLTGEHMILTEEGWEPGENAATYLADDPNWEPDDEVNGPDEGWLDGIKEALKKQGGGER